MSLRTKLLTSVLGCLLTYQSSYGMFVYKGSETDKVTTNSTQTDVVFQEDYEKLGLTSLCQISVQKGECLASGTGCFIAPNMVLTCAHTLCKSDKDFSFVPLEHMSVLHLPSASFSKISKVYHTKEKESQTDIVLLILDQAVKNVKSAERGSIKEIDQPINQPIQNWVPETKQIIVKGHRLCEYRYGNKEVQFAGYGSGEIIDPNQINQNDFESFLKNHTAKCVIPRLRTEKDTVEIQRDSGSYDDKFITLELHGKKVRVNSGDSGSPVFIDGKVRGIVEYALSDNKSLLMEKLTENTNVILNLHQENINNLKQHNLEKIKLSKKEVEEIESKIFNTFKEKRLELWKERDLILKEKISTKIAPFYAGVHAFTDNLVEWINEKIKENPLPKQENSCCTLF
jgi:hypothetical protein